jgi:hypothetical protein
MPRDGINNCVRTYVDCVICVCVCVCVCVCKRGRTAYLSTHLCTHISRVCVCAYVCVCLCVKRECV